MSITLLEDVKIWGMAPRELSYIAASLISGPTAVATFFALHTGAWFLYLAAAMGALSVAMTFSLSRHLRNLAYSAYEAPEDER